MTFIAHHEFLLKAQTQRIMHMVFVLLWYGTPFTNIPALISNYSHHKVRDDITYLIPNFNDATDEVSEWISNYILHLLDMWLLIHDGTKVKPY